MIKISPQDLDTIAQEYLLKVGEEVRERFALLNNYAKALLNGNVKNRIEVYKKSGLHGRTKNVVLEILLDGTINTNTHSSLNVRSYFFCTNHCNELVNFCTWILGHIKNLMIGHPRILKVMHKHTNRFQRVYNQLTAKTNYLETYLINYQKLTSSGYNSWTNSTLTNKLNAKTCFYCNRQSVIAVVDQKGSKIATPQLDHFFDKSTHPLLALSFYNLIPCCSNCNLKKSNHPYELDKHIHPYIEAFGDDGLFSCEAKHLAALQGESEDIEIHINYNKNVSKGKRVGRTAKILGLADIYTKAHKDIVQEIFKKKYISNDSYLQNLINAYPSANLSIKEAYQLAFGNYLSEDDFYKRPLAKFTRDIAFDLDLIDL